MPRRIPQTSAAFSVYASWVAINTYKVTQLGGAVY